MRKYIKITLFLCILCIMCDIVHSSFRVKKIAFAESCSMIVIERSSGRVLYERNADEIKPMASTTKIATAITVIENCDNLSKTVKIPREAVGVEGSSIYLEEGEELSVLDLLHGLMLQSGNDCAVALAISISGNTNDFVALMNNTAIKAGANNTHFMNPHGLHDESHYTTARDLAKISAYAMNNPVFREIVSCKRYTMPWSNRDYGRVVLNKNKILSTFDGGDGIKTGYTKNAGRCLVSSATRNNMNVICVVLNCGPMCEESRRLLSKAFDEYELQTIDPKGLNLHAKVEKGKIDCVGLTGQSFTYPIKKDRSERLTYKIEDVKCMTAPVKKGINNGNFAIYLDKQLIFCQKLYTIYSVDCKSTADYLKEILSA